MLPNHEYVLEKCRELAPRGPILDFGCGTGPCVVTGRAEGLDMVGTDTFMEENLKEGAVKTGLTGTAIFEIGSDGVVPLESDRFDFVFCNMVFEHVANLDRSLGEIARVLRQDGKFLALFPGKEVIWEDHVSIPMVHWFKPDSSLRYPYMRMLRQLGLGGGFKGADPSAWAKRQLGWLDQYTFYRTPAEINIAFANAGFVLEHIEEDYVSFRVRRRGLHLLSRYVRSRLFSPLSRAMCRLYGTQVILATKSHVSRLSSQAGGGA